MPLLELRGLRKDFGGRELFSGVNFSVEAGRKLALIGANGAGKTSLLRIIAGLDDDFGGRVIRSPELRFGYVPQRFQPEPGSTALDALLGDVRAMRAELAAMEESMSSAAAAETLESYGALREAYELADGDAAEETALRLLERAGLGGRADSPASVLSGGEANLLGLLRALVSKPNLLALDEPGNHLDLWGKAWLEDFLKNLPIALILVSHDRWLIDRVAERTLAIEGGGIASYAGGYSAFRLQRLGQAAADGAGWQADRKKLERLEALVKRFEVIAASHVDPAWGRRLRARRSQLEREKAAARERPDLGTERMDLRFADPTSRSTYAMSVQGYRKAFGDRVLLEDSGFDVLRGEKVALVGRNGCGKSSFLRDLVATKAGDGGSIRVSPSARLGYLSQAQDDFPAGKTLTEAFEALGAKAEEIRKLLKRFLFSNDDLGCLVGELSGGELNRLQLARAVWLNADFLILDEPTNHLDIAAREAVEDALCEFEGTILLVSHDRFLLEAVADRVVFVEDGRFSTYEGSFSEYWRDAGLARTREVKAGKGMAGRADAISGKNRKPAPNPSEDEIVERIEALERERTRLEKDAENAVGRRDFAAGRALAAELESVSRKIEKLYDRWKG
jgi:ATP-binding cassette, subfamily F, member 3